MKKLSDRVLKVLERREGEFISGSSIATELGVSRTAVSKAIASLRRKGFVIKSHPRLGYKLVWSDDLSTAQQYLSDLHTELKFTVYYLPSTRSTQDVARNLAEEGVPEGVVILAERQTAGRGRLGRTWYSEPGGLWMTLVLRPKISPMQVQLLSLLAGVAIARAIKNLYDLSPGLKWPNDVLVEARKVCGILVEVSAETDVINYSLLGIGINVNNKLPSELRESATSIHEILGKRVPRIPLLRAVLIEIDRMYEHLKRGRKEALIKEWKKYSTTLGRRVRVIYSDREFEGEAIDIGGDGSLILRLNDGSKIRVTVGDIVHLR